MRIITISGKAESGKDTTAKILACHFREKGLEPLILHYADYLKFVCRQYFGWDGEKDEKGREILQVVGTDIARERDPSFWIKPVQLFLNVFGRDYDYVMMPDCRFPNEIETMKNEYKNTISLLIVRLNYENKLTEAQRNHPSETSLDNFKFDYTITSESGIENLAISTSEFIKVYEL